MTSHKAQTLPPPYETLLIYGAYGWAVEHRMFGASGFPKLPERHLWLPAFHLLLHASDGLEKIRAYMWVGLRAWNVGIHIQDCLDGAFGAHQCRTRLQAAIETLAETARTKVVLPPTAPTFAPHGGINEPPKSIPMHKRRPTRGKPHPPQP